MVGRRRAKPVFSGGSDLPRSSRFIAALAIVCWSGYLNSMHALVLIQHVSKARLLMELEESSVNHVPILAEDDRGLVYGRCSARFLDTNVNVVFFVPERPSPCRFPQQVAHRFPVIFEALAASR